MMANDNSDVDNISDNGKDGRKMSNDVRSDDDKNDDNGRDG